MNSFILNHNPSTSTTTVSQIVPLPSISTFFPPSESLLKLPSENLQPSPVNLSSSKPVNTPKMEESIAATPTKAAVQDLDSQTKRKRSPKNPSSNEESSSKEAGDETKPKKRGRSSKKDENDGRRRRNPPKIIWDAEKDKTLLNAVNTPKYRRTTKKGTNLVNWSAIKKEFFPEATVQCIHQRYHRVIDPELKKESWTAEEDKKILELVEMHGNHSWAELAKFLPGRPDTKIKSRYIQLTKNVPSSSPSTKKATPTSTKRPSRKAKYDSDEEDLEQDSAASEDSQKESDNESMNSEEEQSDEERANNSVDDTITEPESKKVKNDTNSPFSSQRETKEESTNFIPRIVTRRTRASQSNLIENEAEGREGFLKLIEIASSMEESTTLSHDSNFDHNFEAESTIISSYSAGSTHTKIFSIKLSKNQSESQTMELLTKRATEYCNHFQGTIEAISMSFNTITGDNSTVFCVVMFRKLPQLQDQQLVNQS